MWPDHWPKTTQRIASATDAALVAARAGASEVFGDALDDLVGLPYETVTAVHAGMMRELFEELHPDGLTGEDVQTVLTRAVRDGVRWLPSMQPDAVVAVITGALGVQDVEATDPRIAPEQYLTAGLLVLTDLLAARKAAPGPCLRRAIAEIERSETMEMP
ncbi:hypothetical protein [Rhodococcus sp. (in: high G+C Gram-positive bacteria)]|uniref:hypothetical protein n=1 Tax=unclassified Rhodococcus (in: high G+C Gram-positive bacteria) TaxID=192944 RepID=UPI00146F27FC|nr:hypothetical protein [Rhodococcus sp. (in: high G+C Gram-positive bacteria)]MBF0661756.1 hypothetical protein [Rhodococcus sp. (in: high G+C Gram-positive bacteria)]NME80617.1 hypothetical protein [Rhodococcus sp. 105337]